MEINNLITASTREELRLWLTNNKTESYCWVKVSVKPKDGVIQYLDCVEEALCFGWIDGTKKKLDPDTLIQRISPRTKKSNWTELNKARVRRLEKLGLMTEMGRSVLPNMNEEDFIIDHDILNALQSDDETYTNFLNFPKTYQTIRIDTIQSYKHDIELFNTRLEKFITNTKANKIYGQWNDNGRLE